MLISAHDTVDSCDSQAVSCAYVLAALLLVQGTRGLNRTSSGSSCQQYQEQQHHAGSPVCHRQGLHALLYVQQVLKECQHAANDGCSRLPK